MEACKNIELTFKSLTSICNLGTLIFHSGNFWAFNIDLELVPGTPADLSPRGGLVFPTFV